MTGIPLLFSKSIELQVSEVLLPLDQFHMRGSYMSISYVEEPYDHKLTLLTMKQKHNNLTMGLVSFSELQIIICSSHSFDVFQDLYPPQGKDQKGSLKLSTPKFSNGRLGSVVSCYRWKI